MRVNNAIESYLVDRIKELTYPQSPLETGVSPQLKNLEQIKAVVFDVYGTLLIARSGDIGIADEETSDTEAFTAASSYLEITDGETEIAQRGVKLYRDVLETEHKRKKGQGIPYPEVNIIQIWHEVFSLLEEEGQVESGISENRELLTKFAVEFEIRYNPPWPMPNMVQTLKQVGGKRVKLGIVSNSQFYTPLTFKALIGQSVTELGFEPDLLKWSYDNGIAKPSLGLYELLIDDLHKEFDIKPSNTLYIGNDMLNDIYPAHELNIKTALFAGDRRSLKWRENDQRIESVEPDIIATNLSQIPECI